MTRLLAAALEPAFRLVDWALTRLVDIDMDGAGTSDKDET